MNISELKPHPVANIFPMMDEEELSVLAQDIATNGLQEPIIIDPDNMLIIDGRNRLEACQMAGVTPRFVRYSPEKHGSVESLVISRNLHRRHMNKSQIACVAHLLAVAISQNGEMSYTSAQGVACSSMGVSKRYVDMAAEVYREAPPFFDAIFSGGATLYDWEKHKKEATKKASSEQRNGDIVVVNDPDWPTLHGKSGRIFFDEEESACFFVYKDSGVTYKCSLEASENFTEAT
jgi:hypothetical protein